MKRTGAVVALLVAGAALPLSCAKKPSVTLVLLDPCAAQNKSFKEAATYTEITVFKNGCPPDSDLAAGLTLGNTDYPPAFDGVAGKGDPLPKVGDLDKKKYGFAAVMRDANCGVIGFGCTEANLKNIREVRVAVRAWTQTDSTKICDPLKGNGCPTGRVCEQGRCLLPVDGGSGTCNLSVFASGSLPALSTGEAGTVQLTGPTVAASTGGFVVAYRTQVGGMLYAHAALLSPSGTLNAPYQAPLEPCPTSKSPTDGVGLAFSGGGPGVMALSMPDCDGKGAGAYFILVDPATGALSKVQPARASSGAPAELTLAPTHSLSGTGTPDFYQFIYRVLQSTGGSPEIQLAPLQDNHFLKNGGIDTPLGAEAGLFGMVATTSQVEALLARLPTKSATEFDVRPPPGADGGARHDFLLPLSNWGAITAWDDRAAAIAPGSATGLTLQAADVNGNDLGQLPLPGDQFSSGDIVALGDHLIVVGAEAQPQQFTIYRIDVAKGGTPVPEGGPPPDSGTPSEGGQPEAGQPEAGQPEAGQPEGGQPEAGQPEAGQPEAGQPDSGPTQPDAGSSSGALTLASTTTLPLSSLKLPSGASFDGQQVSIAALNGEVAVVWRSKLNPDPKSPGGWALLKCSQ